MSRPSVAPSQRNLTLTEELEKLEQSITLTLQEIDHNFSRAHRIVTTSILPVVESYSTHSHAVWSSTQFWKSFFEASANVSLSSYEEPPPPSPSYQEGATTTETDPSVATPSSSSYASTTPPPQTTPDRHPEEQDGDEQEPTLSTPRPPKPAPPTFSSPYESLKRTLAHPSDQDPSPSPLPSTPRAQQSYASPSPLRPLSTTQHPNPASRTPANDVLLHRILDKNWRLQATPHTQPRLPPPSTSRKNTETPARRAGDELDSSPFVEAPDLNPEIFESPLRRGRVPGVSVLTPARGKPKGGEDRTGGGGSPGGRGDDGRDGVMTDARKGKARGVWDSDSNEEGEDGMGGLSPPKTMQFHVPRERLLRTPAKEASRRIVEDLLLTAGGNVTDDLDEDSPSVVRRTEALDEDTF